MQCFLQLGEGYCLPPRNIESTTIEFIKHLENNLSRLKILKTTEFRNKLLSSLQNIKKICINKSYVNVEVLSALATTKTVIILLKTIHIYSSHTQIKEILL